MNKKKELTAAAHDSQNQQDLPPIIKNIYRVPRALQHLSHNDVVHRRAQLHVQVRGKGVPCPVTSFAETGLPQILLDALQERDQFTTPTPIQAQCIPTILAGRDVIGIAKTGSGKTLA